MSDHKINKEKLTKLLPKGTHYTVTDEMIDTIARMEKDTGLIQEYMEESVLSHLPVLRDVKVDLNKYINAIKYCNLKRNMDNQKAWEITFPERYNTLVQEGRWNSSHSSMYNQSPLVVKIDAQMALSVEIQYAPLFHQMLMKQVELANGWDAHGRETSATVQHLAAGKVLDIVTPKEEAKVAITIGQSSEAKNANMKMYDKMAEIAKNQQLQIEAGMSVEEVQRLNLTIDVDIEDDEDDEYTDQ